MTKLWIFSDLHLSRADYVFGQNLLKIPDADVCVCAGDLTNDWSKSLIWLADNIRPHMPVVFVLGNHEFYGSRLDIARRKAIGTAAGADIHLLDDTSITVDGVRFIGATLWTDFDLKFPDALAKFPPEQVKEHVKWRCQREVQDFHSIKLVNEPITPDDIEGIHHISRMKISMELTQQHDGPTVVVTHHAPHRGSLTPRFADVETSAAFVSDLSSLIEDGKPDLWIHGHTHTSFDYMAGSTRIICNPRGYDFMNSGIENKDFDPQLVIEV